MPRALVCTSWNETTQVCDAQAWQEIQGPSLLPPLSLEDGKAIGDQIVVSLVLVLIVKLFLKPSTHKTR